MKDLPVYRIFLVLGLTLITNKTIAADQFYVAADLSWAGVTSNQEFSNGTQDSATGFTIGYRFIEYSWEISYKKYTYFNTHYRREDSIDVEDYIQDSYIAFGVRGQHNEYFESKLGISINNIQGTFTGSDGTDFYSPVDGTFVGVYFGTGPKVNFNGDLDLYFDFTLRRISKAIFTVGYDAGLRYLF